MTKPKDYVHPSKKSKLFYNGHDFKAYRRDNARIPLWAVIDWWDYETGNQVAQHTYEGAKRIAAQGGTK